MMAQVKRKTVEGLDEVQKMLDGLVDPVFRGRALRNAGRKSMIPVKEALENNVPAGDSETHSYKHYGENGYTSGDLKKGIKLKLNVNTTKDIKAKNTGFGGTQSAELIANVTFENHLFKLAGLLEYGRSKRVATTRNGKVFHSYGNPTDDVQRDIGTTLGTNFISRTFAQEEGEMVERFKKELITAIEKQAKSYERKQRKKNNA